MNKRISVILLALVICLSAAVTGARSDSRKVMNYIAVIDLKIGEGIQQSLSPVLTNVVIEELVKAGKYTVIDRMNRDKILDEVGYQQSGCVDESCSVEMGRQLGVGKIVVGSVTLASNTYIVTLQLLNVETGVVEQAVTQTCICDIKGLMVTARNAARLLMGEKPLPVPKPDPSSPTQPQPAIITPRGDPAAISEETITMFFNAFRAGDKARIQRMLDQYPGLAKVKDKEGKTGFYLAAAYDFLDIAKRLRKMGADVNAPDQWGCAPIIQAAEWGSPEMINYLLDNGADVNSNCHDGVTALYKALRYANQPVIVVLLERGANVNTRTKNKGTTPMHIVVERKHMEFVDLLLAKGANINAPDNKGNTPLHLTVIRGKADMLAYIIDRGANVQAKNNEGNTALHIVKGEDLARILIDHGADINARNNSGDTPLHMAVAEGRVDVANYLISKGANIEIENNEGHTPLLMLFQKRIFTNGGEAAIALISHGANINIRNRDGETPIMLLMAMEISVFERNMAATLVSKGADLNVRNTKGATPLHIICMNNQKRDPMDVKKVIETLIAGRADINAIDNEGNTPLHNAVKNCNAWIVRILLENKANPNIVNKRNLSPTCAAKAKCAEAYKLLVQAGGKTACPN